MLKQGIETLITMNFMNCFAVIVFIIFSIHEIQCNCPQKNTVVFTTPNNVISTTECISCNILETSTRKIVTTLVTTTKTTSFDQTTTITSPTSTSVIIFTPTESITTQTTTLNQLITTNKIQSETTKISKTQMSTIETTTKIITTTQENELDFCQENYGRRLNPIALSYARFIDSKIVSPNPGPCCKLCYQNSKCNYYYQASIDNANGAITNCSLFEFANTPTNFVLDILTGKYYIRKQNGKPAVFTENSIGYLNKYLNI